MSIEPARDSRGHWRRGYSGNPGGRPGGPQVKRARELARSCTEEMIAALRSIALDQNGPQMARVQAAKELLARGWGTASDEATVEALDRIPDEAEIIHFVMPMSIDGIEIEDAELVDDEPTSMSPPAS